MGNYIDAVEAASTSPLALAAYAFALATFAFVHFRSRRNRQLLDKIRHIPASDRKALLQAEMNVVLPEKITAEEWLRSRQQTYLAGLVAAFLLCATAVFAMALFRHEQEPKGPTPDTAGPVFRTPSLGGRTVDACIVSAMFPEQRRMQCIRSAKLEIARSFCRAAGYSQVEDFRTQQTGEYQSSYKLHRNISNGRLVEEWLEDNTGGSIFTLIICR